VLHDDGIQRRVVEWQIEDASDMEVNAVGK